MEPHASPPMPFSLQGKRGLVLGLANEQSIAWGCAKLARQLGAELVGCCLNDKARAYVEPLTRPQGIDLVNCNVEQAGELAALVDHVQATLGGLDFAIHSIAWAPAADLNGPVAASSSEGFARAMTVSCHSFAALAKLCAPLMPTGGSLVTMSYLGAERVVEHYGLMGPVKAALESLTRYLAAELGPQGIRAHAVSPGPIATRAASGIGGFDEIMDNAQRQAALGRLVTLDEIAQLTLFLCSSASSGMTGQTIYVDAGCHLTA